MKPILKIMAKSSRVDIFYGIAPSPFGLAFIAATKQGICALSFIAKKDLFTAITDLKKRWPHASIGDDQKLAGAYIAKIFGTTKSKKPLTLLVQGSAFQIKVWKALLSIPSGKTESYATIAEKAGVPKAVRAVGSACGANTIAYLIPCHRVLTSAGKIGGYRWGTKTKQLILTGESKAE